MNSSTNYSGEQVDLLQVIYRHKIIHLDNAKNRHKNKDRYIAWRYEYLAIKNHLRVKHAYVRGITYSGV